MVVGTIQTKTFQTCLCWFIASSGRHPHQAFYQLREVGISSAIDGYFITAPSVEGATEDESLRRGTCTSNSVGISATRRGTCLPFSGISIAGYSSNFVVDLIQSLVIVQGNHSKDCYVIRCTEERDVTSRSNRMDIRNEVIRAIESSLHNRVLF